MLVGALVALVALLPRGGGDQPRAAAAATTADPRTCAVPASQIRVTPNETWNGRFHAYGDDNTSLSDWTGADGGYTIPLPDGRRLWVFADTFLGKVNNFATDGNHGRPANSPAISNSIVVEEAGRLARTVIAGTDSVPRAYAFRRPETPRSWYWPGTGVVQGDKVRLLLNRFHKTGPDELNLALDGTAVLSIQLPGLERIDDPRSLPVENRGGVMWVHVLPRRGGDFIFGRKANNLYLARAPAGDLLGPWKYRTADGTWSSNPASAAPVIADGGGLDAHVALVNNTFVRLSVKTSPAKPFTNVIQAYFSCSAVGPWTQTGTPIYTTPEATPGDDRIVYDAYIHPETVNNGRMLAHYNVAAYPDGHLNWERVHIYRPRFLTITIDGLP
jgi:hypothetical protein